MNLVSAKEFYECFRFRDKNAQKQGLPYTKDVADAEKILKRELKDKKSYKFGIYVNNKFVGSIALEHPDKLKESYKVGFAIGKKFWNKGIATTALKKATNFSFSKLKLKKIVGDNDYSNKASGKVFEKAGFNSVKRNKKIIFWEKER